MGRMLGSPLGNSLLLLGKIISPTAAKALGDGFCASYSYECLVESSCVDNGNGTFRCSCPVGTSGTGFKKELGGGGCTGTCKSTSECPSYSICDLSTTPGVCRCNNPGFSGDAVQGCTDINECNLQGTTYKACSVNAMCMNSPGSYSCVCQSHYRGDGYSCQWICSSAADCALGKATCVRPGDYCKCLSGFSGDGITCDDIDECATGTSRCPANTVCVNTIGNYTCKCRPGYALNPDTNTCVALARHCDERYTWDNKMKSGYFTVDFDFDGPMEPKQVYCDVRAGYAITEIQFGKGESFPRDVPRTAGEDRPVDYGMKIEELRQLVDNSPYCSQIVSLTCTSKYGSGSGTFSWRDGKGNSQTAWGGSSTAGKCACGEMNSCIKGNCNCGNGVDAVDKGIIYNKNLLPIQAISFPSSGGAAGYYEIGRLRCAKQPVDIPRNCHDVKFVIKEKFNLAYPICPDGVRIFMVQCDVETYKHTGVSKALLTNPVIGTTTTNGEDIKYLVDRESIAALINGSVYCSQRLEYKCRYYLYGNACLRFHREAVAVASLAPVLQIPQFCAGIEPNCEKYRQGGLTNIDYGLMIDPDGPGGNCTSFPAQCKIDDVQGMTIIRHDNPNGIRASAPFKVVLKYLRASPDQLALLKKRSTYCKQTISLTYSGSISPANIQLKYSDGNSGSVESVLPCVQTRTCAYTTGQGTDSLVLSSLDKVPVTEVSASSSAFSGTASVTMKIGPLECAEIFPDCATYLNFVKTQGVEGEVNIMKDLLTVDPDAEGEGAPFTVSCIYSDSYIDRPVTYSNRITQRPKQGPITQCFTISYQDQGGRNISEGQLAAFVKGNRRCQQSLQIGAQGAPVVNYATIRRCGSNVTEPTLVSALSSSYCECGIHGLCDSGPTAQCNGDAAP
ncbi:hypothetical protein C0Q70_02867 [Pomacea canaliculata]|uniref:EGF-like domain-containing protein n=1 Tax=Pomacea canaliculata TaxID=400727 RepID=A0A2T7PR55_POMCA|nr:hypothetical protein C0Q70_02867 [Pomacea canaliculata]